MPSIVNSSPSLLAACLPAACDDRRAAALIEAIARGDADRELRTAAKAIREARAASPP